MPSDAVRRHDKLTIVSMAVIASAVATLLHEGVGHGLTAFVRGDVPTELTSNHLSSLHPDRMVQAAGTIVNLIAGVVAMLAASRGNAGANARYFFWILGALNLLPGAGYFMFSGIFGFGDWNEVISGMPYHAALRVGMTLGGTALYASVVRWLAVTVKPFVPERSMYNTVGRLPYCAAGLFSCAAGLFDPLGLPLLLVSTIPAAFGGVLRSVVGRQSDASRARHCTARVRQTGCRMVGRRRGRRRRVHRGARAGAHIPFAMITEAK